MPEKWDGLVPCENEFDRLSTADPALLVDWVERGGLGAPSLTFAAEALGRSPAEVAVPCLLKLLEHESPLVREGAIYGAAAFTEGRPEVLAKLRELAERDASPTIRETAREALGD